VETIWSLELVHEDEDDDEGVSDLLFLMKTLAPGGIVPGGNVTSPTTPW